jgi:NTE family protein
MRFFILLFLFFTLLLDAAQRPKIALVLSGGGARGGAHVGVLKVLEQNHIPIDLIIGTSMGSFIGGLYAAGKSPQEIENILLETKWHNIIRTDFERSKIPIQKKRVEYRYQGRLGVGLNKKNEVVLPTGVLKREPLLMAFDKFFSDVKYINDFDKLSIPFRAVATDITNGEAVILKSGSIAEAVYASSAIPGGLQPITIDGKNLVDGGVSKNFPIEIAKEMGADVVIAVDVSEPFDKNIDVNSYLVVMGQLINIMMRKNADESIKYLTKKDILITPNLDGFSGLDVEHYAQIIKRGQEAAKKKQKVLKELSITPQKYQQFLLKQRADTKKREEKIIDYIVLKNNTYLSDMIIKSAISQKVGTPFDDNRLRQDILKLYSTTLFDTISYKLQERNGKRYLVITVTPSWNTRGDIFFSLSLEDNFKSNNNYSLKFGYWLYGINEYGAEWRNDIEVGSRRFFHTEFYQPFTINREYYIRPFFEYEDMTYHFPTQVHGNQELNAKHYGGGFGVGANINSLLNIETYIYSSKDRNDLALFDYSHKFISKQIGLKIIFDSLDNYSFANSGLLATIEGKKELPTIGSSYDYNQLYATIQKPFSYKNNSFIFNAKVGLTDIKEQNTQQMSIRDKFSLGGMFNLSGYQAYTLVSNNIFFTSLMYRYRIKNGGFFGSLGMPLYAGFTVESGASWEDGKKLTKRDIKYAGSLYISAETPFGPFYFTYGVADSAHQSLYLYLGEKF